MSEDTSRRLTLQDVDQLLKVHVDATFQTRDREEERNLETVMALRNLFVYCVKNGLPAPKKPHASGEHFGAGLGWTIIGAIFIFVIMFAEIKFDVKQEKAEHVGRYVVPATMNAVPSPSPTPIPTSSLVDLARPGVTASVTLIERNPKDAISF